MGGTSNAFKEVQYLKCDASDYTSVDLEPDGGEELEKVCDLPKQIQASMNRSNGDLFFCFYTLFYTQ